MFEKCLWKSNILIIEDWWTCYGSKKVAILSELNIYSLGKIYGQCENLILIICKENIWTVKKKKCSRYYFSLMRSNVLFQQIKCAIQCFYPFCLSWKFLYCLIFLINWFSVQTLCLVRFEINSDRWNCVWSVFYIPNIRP